MVQNNIEKTVFLAAFIFLTFSVVTAMKETAIPVNDVGEGSQCDQDQRVANTCLACSALPFDLNIPLVECCSDEYVFDVCNACIDNKKSCIELVKGLSVHDESSEKSVYDAKNVDFSKRFGTLFLKSSRNALKRQKRYGRLFVKSPYRNRRSWLYGKRDGGAGDDDLWEEYLETPDKKYGRLYLGSGNYFRKFGKRADFDDNMPFDDIAESPDKRYGRLYLGGGGYFRKFGKRDDNEVGDATWYDIPDKRYGRLYLGSTGGGYFGKYGKRGSGNTEFWDEYFETPDKRYGRLFIGSGGRYYGTRDILSDKDKRYGRLFVGSGDYFGKRLQNDFQDAYDSDVDNVDKRFGKLFVGSGGYFGKREDNDETENEYDFADNPLGSSAEEADSDITADKRFGTLFMGGKFRRYFKNFKRE